MPNSSIDENGAVCVRQFELPASSLLSPQSKQLFVEQARLWEQIRQECTPTSNDAEVVRAFRDRYRDHLRDTLRKQERRFDVVISQGCLNGVPVEMFDPVGSRCEMNAVLINLHGGGFVLGDCESARIESIPIAAISGVRVVSVDYRMAPEFAHPAAAQDATSVYEHLINSIPPERIGIFGSSAGALLAAQVVALLDRQKLPLPAALGLFGMGATRVTGDTMTIFSAVEGAKWTEGDLGPYFRGTLFDDSSAFPCESSALLARFPPTLLLSSVRDLGLSSVASTHSRLVEAGVLTQLHIWEGLRHCFYYDPEYAESQQAYRVAGSFFRRHLKVA